MKEDFAKRLKYAMMIRGMKQVDLVEKTGLQKSAISQYVAGKYEPKQKGIYSLAQALDVNEAWLMGYDVEMDKPILINDELIKIEKRSFPLLGTIAAGEPIYADQQFEVYVELGANLKADFCLKIKGDSMINARIQNGDIVFIRNQPDVDDGEIAAVLIGDEATLKRVYKRKNEVILIAENPTYQPIVYRNEELNLLRIIGKAVAFQSDIN